jgi:hypothetical protein
MYRSVIDATQLVGTAEVADRFGLAHPESVHAWRRRYADFPEPLAVVSSVHVWSWPDVKRWAKRTGRLPAE